MSLTWIVNICNNCNFDKLDKLKRFKNIADIPLIQYQLKDGILTMTCPKCEAVEEIMFDDKGERIFK